MRQVIRNEITKTLSYRTFRIIILLHFVLFFLVVLVMSRLDITVPGLSTRYFYQFPNIWEFFPWVASWFNLLLAIMVIVMTGNEYTFRTFRQHVIDGLGRWELLAGKGFVILMTGVYSTLMVLLFSLIFGFVFSSGIPGNFFDKTYILLVYFVQAIAYMAAGLLLVILFRSTALGITLFILYRLVIEPVARLFFAPRIRLFFPMKVISDLTPTPEFLSMASGSSSSGGAMNLNLRETGLLPETLPVLLNVSLALGYTALFLLLAYLLLRERNL